MSFIFELKKIDFINMNICDDNIKEMDLNGLVKTELLLKCHELGFKKYKSKSKSDLIELIKSKKPQNKIKLIIEDDSDNEDEKKKQK